MKKLQSTSNSGQGSSLVSSPPRTPVVGQQRMQSIEREAPGQDEDEDELDELDASMELANTQSQGIDAMRDSHRRTAQSEEDEEHLETGNGEEDPNSDSESESDDAQRPALHIEVRLRSTSTVRYDLLRTLLHTHLNDEYETLLTHSEVYDWREVPVLAQNVDRVWIGECSLPTQAVPLSEVALEVYIYQPPSSSKITEFSTSAQNDEDGDSDVPAASVLELPSLSLEGVWDTLIYEGHVKEKLLGYIHSTMLFSDASVNFDIVTWNRVVLLHGPPGTGKTSLCRSLAQKLAIRLSDRYEYGKLIEINSHSLFSKWFSESGKLVQRLFAQVTEMVDDPDCFVVVLIDEVESLTAARAGAMSGKEPSDALRVVNALLTQLDKLKHRKNCLVMTTSNLSSAIDNAFIDRADIKQYIGLPPTAAVYWILRSCLLEMMRVGLIPSTTLYDYKTLEFHQACPINRSTLQDLKLESEPMSKIDRREWECSLHLLRLAHKCQGMSGRTLRRLPVLAHARHLQSFAQPQETGSSSSSDPTCKRGRKKTGGNKVERWLQAIERCVEEEQLELSRVENGDGARGTGSSE
ncbi:Pch2p [Sporobolomyces koalae]|uniref:Pch2p n=1 Tax=Sporobolomyces koalae TaxID=500713 RepID=UPI003173405C